jgi:hypothetical protein
MKREGVVHRDPYILGSTPVLCQHPGAHRLAHPALKHGKRIDEFLDDVPSVRREQAEAFLDIAGEELVVRAE